MDQIRTGELIRRLRMEIKLTQKELAEKLSVSDKAVSKWESGKGCPDISLLYGLAEIFGTDINVLLSGELEKNESEKGNMKKLRFYICRKCGNIITSTSEAAVTCCGSRLTAEKPRKADENDALVLEDIGGEWAVSSSHPMTKEHYISFVAYVRDSAAMIYKMYPEWDLQFIMPMYRSGRLLWFCTEHGLLYRDIKP